MAVRLALIGCGGISRQHLNGYTAIKAAEPDLFELVAVCDADRERADAAAAVAAAWQPAPPRVYTDVTELLERERLDAADVCTPHFLHHTVGVACLNAGLHVQVEKPIGVTIRATRLLIDTARRNQKILATAENVRRMPGPRTAHWLFHERGLLGAPTALYSQRVAPPTRPRAASQGGATVPAELQWVWRMDRALSGGGPVMDSGAHFCDTIRYLYGDVESCYGRVLSLSERRARRGDDLVPVETEDTFMATINFANGAVGFWSVSSALAGHQITNVAYYGRDGAIVEPRDPFHGPRLESQVTLRDSDPGGVRTLQAYYEEFREALGEAGQQRVFPHGMVDGFALESYDFLTAVRDSRPPEIDGEGGLRAKAIAVAIYESAATGQAVRVEDVLSGRVREYQRPIDERWEL